MKSKAEAWLEPFPERQAFPRTSNMSQTKIKLNLL